MRRALLLALGPIWLALAGPAGAARIVAVGDVHGEIYGLEKVLQAAALIDEEGRWVGDDAILVQTGDVTDRGSQVRAVMDRLRSLEEQAPAQGGRVVPLLGNHEINNLMHLFDEHSTPRAVYREIWAAFAEKGSERRQRAAYKQWRNWLEGHGCVQQGNGAWLQDKRAWLEDHPPGFVEYIEALSPTGEYGRWLRSLGVAAKIDGVVFLHGGLSPQLVEQGYDSVEAINDTAARAIAQLDRDRQQLVDEGLILPFSTHWETHCALFMEMARLEEEGEPEALARRAELEKLRAGLPGMPGWFLTDENGPVWFRGLATWDETEMESALVGVLDAFSAQRVVVGHTPQLGKILPRFGGRVYLIDTAMAYGDKGGRAAALEIDGDRVTAVYTDERVPLTEEPSPAAVSPEEPAPVEGTNGQTADAVEGTNGDSQETLTAPEERESAADGESTSPGSPTPIWLGPDGRPLPFADDQEVLEFLAKAKIVGDAKIDVGITKPRRLELERDGIRARAIFHDVEIEKQRIKLHGGELVNFFRDHYANNVAAYELSRLLGMTNVPPAVVRRLGGQPGSVQLWIENAKTDADRRQMEIEPPAASRLTRLDMWVFDNLINNIDRNQTNILYDANWNLWFIDHTRTFGRGKELPSPERVSRCSRRLWRALLELDEEETRKRLKPFLGIYEIRGMLARRKLLIALLEERIARLGEKAVLFSYSDSSVTAGEEEIEIPEAPAPPRD